MKLLLSLVLVLAALSGSEDGADPRRSRPVVIGMGGVCWDHLRYTSPGSLTDNELTNWGYEPDWAGPEFVAELREIVKNPIELLEVREGHHLVLLKFPTYYHAEAVLKKLREVGTLRMGVTRGFPDEIREEGRCFLIGAARGQRQLKEQTGE